MRYFIVDDDVASRKMLGKIVHDEALGIVIGEAESGVKAIPLIMSLAPDLVLIDLLMPELDGIETISQLKERGFHGRFIMISQIENKEMVGEAYEKGVQFFVHKPINKIEVKAVLTRVAEQIQFQQSFHFIQQSLGQQQRLERGEKKSARAIVNDICGKLGIVGEAGLDDLVMMIEILLEQAESIGKFPPLKQLYLQVAERNGIAAEHIHKESKAIEQRLRRALLVGLHHLASLGAVDYMNPEFEYYAPKFFEFEEVRKQMIAIQEKGKHTTKVKINIKKFIQMLYLEVKERIEQ